MNQEDINVAARATIAYALDDFFECMALLSERPFAVNVDWRHSMGTIRGHVVKAARAHAKALL